MEFEESEMRIDLDNKFGRVSDLINKITEELHCGNICGILHLKIHKHREKAVE